MKRFIVLFVVFACLVSGNAFAQNMMHIKIDNYSISVPEGWSAQYTNSATVFFLYSPIEENDTFQENANLTTERLPTKYTEKGYLTAVQGIINNTYSNFKVLENAKDYHIISYTSNRASITQIQYVSIRDNVAYIMTYTSTSDNFSRYLETFKAIQKTFKY